MTYVMSDTHGFWEPYSEAVGLLGTDDVLYVLGDAIDRGSEGIRILQDIMARKNVHMIKGNHELMVSEAFQNLYWSHSSPYDCSRIITDEMAMGKYGQYDTLCDFRDITKNEKLAIITFIEQLPLFISVTVGKQNFLMAHGGIPEECSSDVDIEYYADEETLLWGPHDFNAEHAGVAHIVGHLPTRNIAGAEPDKIYRNMGNIDLDCGLGFGGQLGVLCLDTMEEYYF